MKDNNSYKEKNNERIMERGSYPIFNLSLEFEDWRGPFEDMTYFLAIARRILPFERYTKGHCCVDNTGQLHPFRNDPLHTCQGHITPIQEDHLHLFDSFFPNSTILEMTQRDGKIYLELPTNKPIYRLSGLYQVKGSRTISEKLEAIVGELRRHKRIAEGENVDIMTLKELEELYRERISNQ